MNTLPKSILTKSQKQIFGSKIYTQYGKTFRIRAEVRHDDECGNGHNSFSITGTIDRRSKNGRWEDYSGGCIHDEIIKHFSDLKPYIKWHLTSTDGPMHYLANTLYLAGDKDCWGLKKGEVRQLIDPKTGLAYWKLTETSGKDLEKYVHTKTRPTTKKVLEYVPWTRTGEGNEPNIEAARRSAVWPDATLEQLQDSKTLEARLVGLMEEFKKDVETLGFIY